MRNPAQRKCFLHIYLPRDMFFEWGREREVEATISTLKSSNNPASAIGFEYHHASSGGRRARKCCLNPTVVSQPWTAGLGERRCHSHRLLVIHYTWVPSVSHLSFLGAVYLDELDFQTSEDCFLFTDLFDMLSGMFVLDAASNALINQTLLPWKEDDLNIWSANLTYNHAESLTAFEIPKLILHSRKTFSFYKKTVPSSTMWLLQVIMATKKRTSSLPKTGTVNLYESKVAEHATPNYGSLA